MVLSAVSSFVRIGGIRQDQSPRVIDITQLFKHTKQALTDLKLASCSEKSDSHIHTKTYLEE
ncbi:hypothetical protein AXA44_43835 [Rhodococcus sp. SC4]|nr:hypothetical protein AXA44_43835 [Rhodococcus sp. SC4]KXX62153.1 hypothetical protein AZG88_30680 [Rhodococcus sp. LB1]PBC49377.1 hypothetical protein CJ177_39260 [Rhodococcus sp. ACPA1]